MSLVQHVATGYEPRAWQRRVHNNLKRFSVLPVHRRGGKTVMAVNTLIDGAVRCTKPMPRFGYLAPFLKQARAVAWDYVRFYTQGIPGMDYESGLMIATFPNGAKLQLFGADNYDALRGMYFDGIVPDEVADMRPQVWGEIIRPALTDRNGWALFIGTPKGINLFSELYFRAVEDPDWYAEVLTCYDTDSLPPEEIERTRRELTEAQFAQEMLCDFHAAVENTLISVSSVQTAMDRVLPITQYQYAARIMGVDVAWMGNDRSAIAKVQGMQSHGHKSWRGIDPMDLAGMVAQEAVEFKPDAIFIDLGYAPGVCSRVQKLGFPATGVNFGGKASDPRFENKRAEMWWNMAEWVQTAALPQDHALVTDFCATTYKPSRSGRIMLESKEDMRSRGMPSPDIGDAYALCRAHPVVSAEVAARRDRINSRSSFCEHEYDPLEV